MHGFLTELMFYILGVVVGGYLGYRWGKFVGYEDGFEVGHVKGELSCIEKIKNWSLEADDLDE